MARMDRVRKTLETHIKTVEKRAAKAEKAKDRAAKRRCDRIARKLREAVELLADDGAGNGPLPD